MATIINEEELKQFVQEGNIIQNGDESCAEGLKYDLRLGNRFLKAGNKSGERTFEQLYAKDQAFVDTGEVVFVMTKERLDIPLDVKVSLFDKRKLSHDGINLLGGRFIDPGYKGYLIFGIHNVAGKAFPLKPGRKLIGAEFTRLTGSEVVKKETRIPRPIENFPEDIEKLIDLYKPINPNTINQKLEELQTNFSKEQTSFILRFDNVDKSLLKLDRVASDLRVIKIFGVILSGIFIALIAGLLVQLIINMLS
ncbi:MAG: hypothetical protein FWG91_08700 [Lachnospiraceae bacterium]|nr:hypothetical protein [Lachnospiraceae bacterium]